MASGTTFALVFCLLLPAAVWMAWLPAWTLLLYLSASVLTFSLYALDKSAARNRRRRIREKTLHVCGLCGGWPGALLAQNLLRHKSSKRAFQTVFWLTVGVNCSALGWLLTPRGAIFLQAMTR